jgi:hypothetical protein
MASEVLRNVDGDEEDEDENKTWKAAPLNTNNTVAPNHIFHANIYQFPSKKDFNRLWWFWQAWHP